MRRWTIVEQGRGQRHGTPGQRPSYAPAPAFQSLARRAQAQTGNSVLWQDALLSRSREVGTSAEMRSLDVQGELRARARWVWRCPFGAPDRAEPVGLRRRGHVATPFSSDRSRSHFPVDDEVLDTRSPGNLDGARQESLGQQHAGAGTERQARRRREVRAAPAQLHPGGALAGEWVRPPRLAGTGARGAGASPPRAPPCGRALAALWESWQISAFIAHGHLRASPRSRRSDSKRDRFRPNLCPIGAVTHPSAEPPEPDQCRHCPTGRGLGASSGGCHWAGPRC